MADNLTNKLDLVDRGAIIEKLLDMHFYPAIVKSVIEKAPAVDVGPEWISVKDRLPEDAGREVFVTAINVFGQKNTTVAFMGYGDNKWHFSVSSYRAWRVTHWMEKPEPAKEADDENY